MNSTQYHLLPLKNKKIIDLKTLDIRDKTDEKFSFELNCDFITDLTNIDKYFYNMFDTEEEIRYLQTLLGYCITGELDENMRNIIYFSGIGHGKSTICHLLRKILSDMLCSLLPEKLFIKNRLSLVNDNDNDDYDNDDYDNDDNDNDDNDNNDISPEIYRINGKRLCYIELNNTDEFNHGLLKYLISKDLVSARNLHNNGYSLVRLTSKYVLISNRLPENIPNLGNLRRIICIPFIKNLMNKDINTELNINEFFSWLCVGASNYYRLNGKLKIPQSFIDATRNIGHIEYPDS